MRQCPLCLETYNDTWKNCLRDDAPLTESGNAGKRATAKPFVDKKFKEVGGWLAFYVWGMLLLGPVAFVMAVYTLVTGNANFIYPSGLPYFLQLTYVILSFAEIAAALALLRPKPSSVMIVRGVLLAWAIFRLGTAYLVRDRGLNEMITAALTFFFSEFVWLLYFFFSRRVRARYYPEPSRQKDKWTASIQSHLNKL